MIQVENRKARYDYTVISEVEAGIELVGTEIKSIRKGSVALKDSYVIIRNDEAYIINMYIAKYNEASMFNHDERRDRKLLLHKKEIRKLKEQVQMEGYSLIPLKLYFKHNKVKVLIGLCKGKKKYDKRATLKEKELKREASINM